MILFYFLAGLLFLCISLVSGKKLLTSWSVGIFLLIQLVFTVYIFIHPGITQLGYFTYDSLGRLLLGIMTLLAISSFYHGLVYLKHEPVRNFNIYHAGFIGLIVSITGVYLANNILVTWIFTEATTLSVAALIYHKRTVRALEATWKYIFICSTGIAIAYMGILFLSPAVNKLPNGDMAYSTLMIAVKNSSPLFLKISFLFLLIGFSAKMEIFPLYTIGIDANYVAPAPASAFISTALVNAGFCAIFRAYKVFAGTAILGWINHILILTGVLSLLIAAIYMQRVKNFKRMFAYSTVENMGVVLLGVAMGGIGYAAALFQLILHSFTKSSLFYQMGQAHRIQSSYKIFKTGDYLKLYPAGALVLILGLIAISAIPPSGMFISELLIFKSMFLNKNELLFLITVLLLCFIIYGMMSKVLQLIFLPMEKPILDPVRVNPVQTLSQYVFLGIVVWLCFEQPPSLMKLISDAAMVVAH